MREIAKKWRKDYEERIRAIASPMPPVVRLKDQKNAKTAHIFDKQGKLYASSNINHVARCGLIVDGWPKRTDGDFKNCPACGTQADFDAVLERERKELEDYKRGKEEESNKRAQEYSARVEALKLLGDVMKLCAIGEYELVGDSLVFGFDGRKYVISEQDKQ